MNAPDCLSSLPPPRRRPSGAPAALDGIRILDFTRLIAGPYGTLLLADLGADVIKVENPNGGDDSRGLMPPDLGGESAVYVWANRNKRSIALDLRVPAGRDVALALARQADVVVENFSAGVMDRLGLSYQALSSDNPRLIYCAVSTFGREGRFSDRPGYDPIAQAESGFLSLNGFPDQDPVRAGSSIIDISTGMMTCNAVLGALMARERHGVGQYVEVALFDDAVVLTGQYGMNYLMTGQDQMRPGNGSNTAEPVGLFPTQNGAVYMTCANDRIFRKLVIDVLGRPELATDPDYATNSLRMKNRVALHATLRHCFAERTREVLLERGHAAGVPIGLVRTVKEAFQSEELAERALVSRIPHPSAGMVPNIGAPFRLFGTPIADPVAAPLLGQHTEEVLQELLDSSASELGELRAAGAFGQSN